MELNVIDLDAESNIVLPTKIHIQYKRMSMLATVNKQFVCFSQALLHDYVN